MIKVVSSLDSPFAIADTLRQGFKNAEEVCISSPWTETPFIHLLRNTVPKGICQRWVIKTPSAYDKTYRAMEALEAVSKEMKWKPDLVCAPYLHAKFFIVYRPKDTTVYFGSANPTINGLYHSNEVLVAFHKIPMMANCFRRIFEAIRKQRCNLPWELVRDFHGTSRNRTLMEITLRFFRERAYKEARISALVVYLQNNGFNFNRAKEGVQAMLNSGALYCPRDGFVKLIPKYG